MSQRLLAMTGALALLLSAPASADTLDKTTLGCLHKATLHRTLLLSKDNRVAALKTLVDRAVAAGECAFLEKGESVKTIVDSPESGLACVETRRSAKCLYVGRLMVVP